MWSYKIVYICQCTDGLCVYIYKCVCVWYNHVPQLSWLLSEKSLYIWNVHPWFILSFPSSVCLLVSGFCFFASSCWIFAVSLMKAYLSYFIWLVSCCVLSSFPTDTETTKCFKTSKRIWSHWRDSVRGLTQPWIQVLRTFWGASQLDMTACISLSLMTEKQI